MARKEQYPSDVPQEVIEWYRQPGWKFVDAVDPLADYVDMSVYADDERYARIPYAGIHHLTLIFEKPAKRSSLRLFLSTLATHIGKRRR